VNRADIRLRVLAIVAAILASASLLLWLLDLAPTNPFVALLVLVASPFLYAMGGAINTGKEKE
jgi:hypothetical protein